MGRWTNAASPTVVAGFCPTTRPGFGRGVVAFTASLVAQRHAIRAIRDALFAPRPYPLRERDPPQLQSALFGRLQLEVSPPECWETQLLRFQFTRGLTGFALLEVRVPADAHWCLPGSEMARDRSKLPQASLGVSGAGKNSNGDGTEMKWNFGILHDAPAARTGVPHDHHRLR
jgi:hypothetical protein